MKLRILFVAGAVFVGVALARADQSLTWNSPHQVYRATYTQDDARQFSKTQITSVTDGTAQPLYEGIGGSAGPILTPPIRGYWSGDDQRLIVVSGRKVDSGYVTVDCQIIEKDPRTSRFNLKTSAYQPYPQTVNEEACDRLFILHPEAKSSIYGKSGMLSCRWTGEKTLETDNESDFSTGDGGGRGIFNYRAQWSATLEVTDKGFVTTGLGPARYAVLNAQQQPGAWQTFSVTDQDRLRIAVRLGQQDKATQLLAQGVKPESDPVANLLSIAVSKNDPAMSAILIKAGANVNQAIPGKPLPLQLAVMSPDGKVFDQVIAARPAVTHDTSEDIYFNWYDGLQRQLMPGGGMKTEAQAADVMAEFARRLRALKQAGFDINAADERTGETFLHSAIEQQGRILVIKTLLDAGADPLKRNKAGKSPADLAADSKQLDLLRLLDADHRHAGLLTAYAIPSDSPFIGNWGDNYVLNISLQPDGSGLLASMFSANIAWRQSGSTIEMEMRPIGANRPGVVFLGKGHLSPDGKTLLFQSKELTGGNEQKLDRLKK